MTITKQYTSHYTSSVRYDDSSKTIFLKGRGLENNRDAILYQFDLMKKGIDPEKTFFINLSVNEVNDQSVKSLFHIFSKMQTLHRKGLSVYCRWFINSSFEETLETADDFNNLYEFPIKVIKL